MERFYDNHRTNILGDRNAILMEELSLFSYV